MSNNDYFQRGLDQVRLDLAKAHNELYLAELKVKELNNLVSGYKSIMASLKEHEEDERPCE